MIRHNMKHLDELHCFNISIGRKNCTFSCCPFFLFLFCTSPLLLPFTFSFPSSQFPIGFQSRLKNKVVMLLSKFKLGTIDILKIKLSKSEREKWVKILCSWFPSEMLKSTFAVKVQTWLASHF